MDNAIAVKDDFKISKEDIKKYIAKNATDEELYIFMGICKSYGLNPFKREIHFVKRKYKDEREQWHEKGDAIIGYEIYLKRAERTGKLDGWKCWIEDKGKPTERAIIEIKRKDQSMPITWEVYRSEFDTGKSTWKKMGNFMTKKVCISQGFRLAFPDELGGLPYIPEELPNENDVTSEKLDKSIIDVTVETKPETPKDDVPIDIGNDDTPEEFISEAQVKRLFAIARNSGWSTNDLKEYLKGQYNVEHSKDINKSDYEEIVKWIEAHNTIKVA